MNTPDGAGFEALIPLLFFFAVIGMFVIMVMATRAQVARVRANFARLASSLGLELVAKDPVLGIFGPPPRLEGTLRGRRLRVYSYTTGSGKHRTQWCAMAMGLRNAKDLQLTVSPENMLTKIGHAIGVEDVAVGDAEFDRLFYLKSNAPDYVRAAFIPEVCSRFLEALTAGSRGKYAVDRTEVVYAEVGSFSRRGVVERFEKLPPLLSDLATIVDVYGE